MGEVALGMLIEAVVLSLVLVGEELLIIGLLNMTHGMFQQELLMKDGRTH
jgi:hypothetical protein